MKKYKRLYSLFWVLALISFARVSYCQISGPTSATINQTVQYYFSNSTVYTCCYSWYGTNGNAVSTWSNGSGYYVSWKWTNGGNGVVNFSAYGQLLGTLNVSVSCPTVSTPNGSFLYSSACGNNTITYTGTPPAGITWYWQTSATGTSTANSSSVYTPTVSGIHYLRANCGSTWSAALATNSITLTTATPTPAAPISNTTCNPVVLSYNGTAPSGVSWYWQGTNSSGQDYTSATATSSTYKTTSVGTHYIKARNNTTGCWSSSASIYVGSVPAAVAAPNVPLVSSNLCGAKTLSYNGTPANGTLWYWQGSNSSGTDYTSPTATATTYSASTNSSTTSYYIAARRTSTGCWSTPTSIMPVVTNPPAPALSTTTFTYCEGDVMVMNPTSTGYSTLKWYNSSNQLLTTAATYTAVADLNNGTYTYKVKNLSANGCEGQLSTDITLQVGGATANCDNFLNWQEDISYTYTGLADQTGSILSHSKSYQDGFGKTIQSQSKSVANNNMIFASQSIFDAAGNQSLSTLTAPMNSTTFGYRHRFVTNPTGQKYSWVDFDKKVGSGSGEVNNPLGIGNNGVGTLGWYYSSANNLEPLTPQTNFPYTRSYTPEGPDPTTSKSAGVGENNKMGSGHEVYSERFTYQKAELTHYFALANYFRTSQLVDPYNAPYGYKQVSTDPNGKKAVVFQDADGRTLASAIIIGGIAPNFTYSNWSYSYYNDAGQLVASVAPNGVNTASTSMPSFVTYYKYDHLGRMIETTSPDEGMSQFVYSTDGKVRFSQNQLQREATPKRFSYTNYDYLGRLIESGEYEVSGTTPYLFEPHTTITPAATSVLNIIDNVGFTGVTGNAGDTRCKETNYIQYDTPATDYITDALHPVQDYLIGQVTRTKNDHVTTWYSYDEFGQLTWMKQNIAGLGIKTIDYTYDYLGNVQKVAYQQGQPDAFYHHYDYDQNGRLTIAYTSLDGVTKTIRAKYFYYLHGPLKRVELGGAAQGIDYVYNIDGSLKFINHPDPTKDFGQDGIGGVNVNFKPDVFGMALDYNSTDYTPANSANAGTFNLPGYADQYGGAVKSIRWHNQTDSHVPRGYAFNYDNRYQLTNADFGSVTGAGTYGLNINTTSGSPNYQQYKEAIGGYDANGNIQSLVRKGKTGNSLANFTYNYTPSTNKLASINDNGSALLNYQYNSIGQMTQQTEGSNTMKISYTAYGLTKEIRDGANQLKASYLYDDRGNRVKKTTYTAAGMVQSLTFYVSDVAGNTLATYEQNVAGGGSLNLTELPVYASGRIGMYKPLASTTFFEVIDHLGNVRGVIGVPSTIAPTATLETANQTTEQSQFLRYANAKRVQSSLFDKTNGSATGFSERLNGSANEKYGLAMSLNVMPGDVINTEVYAKYADPVTSNWNSTLTTLMAQVAANTAGVVVDGGSYSSSTSSFPTSYGALLSKTTNGAPKAYLNWLIFDSNFLFVTGGFRQITTAGKETGSDVAHELVASPTINITQPGYVYIYLSNEETTPVEVYFDDFKVTHVKSNVVAGADYYPFGLPMENREITREDYRYGYQGQYAEEDKETGWNAFELRMYDARIGRTLNPDPYGQFASPFVWVGNNPVTGMDPNGGFCISCIFDFIQKAQAFANGLEVMAAGGAKSNMLSGVLVVGSKLPTFIERATATLQTTFAKATTFLSGAANGYNSTITLGLIPEQDPSRQGYSAVFAEGQDGGRFVAMLQGGFEMFQGGALTIEGGALTLTGSGAVIGVPAMGAGVALAGHGYSVFTLAKSNLGKVHNVNSSGNSSGGVVSNGLKKFNNKWNPDVPIKDQIKGQLGKLIKHFNVKGFSIEELVQKTPRQVEEMLKGMPNSDKVIQQINKAIQDGGHYF
jgi:RHS repeat-associated protein